jgi:hypothetical protein
VSTSTKRRAEKGRREHLFFFRSLKIELERKNLQTLILSRRKWEKEDGGKMIKAFIVVNNHAMVRLCRFYEQLVRVFTPSHSDERNFFLFSLSFRRRERIFT